jgi:hypothetical protein
VGLSAAYSFLQTDRGFVGLSSFERKMITKVDRFASSGTWTVPAGVTYAVAHIRGGGGGVHSSTDGGDSSVAFASGTITAKGGKLVTAYSEGTNGSAGADNSGQGGFTFGGNGFGSVTVVLRGGDGAEVVAGSAVTPADSVTVTVGAGGTGTRAGGSGYVWIEYQVAL